MGDGKGKGQSSQITIKNDARVQWDETLEAQENAQGEGRSDSETVAGGSEGGADTGEVAVIETPPEAESGGWDWETMLVPEVSFLGRSREVGL